jgi:sigma-B regulation protein RsbU (phosphoserine phosphatase)
MARLPRDWPPAAGDPPGGRSTRSPDDPGTAALRPLAPAGTTVPAARRGPALLESRLARILLAVAAARLAHAGLAAAVGPSPALDAIGTLISVVLGGLLVYGAMRLLVLAKRRLLWRVRRRLVLSYILIGVVPVLLVITFFLFAGLLMFIHVSAYLFKRGIDDVVDEAVVIAQTAAVELRRSPATGAREVLERKRANSEARYREISLALVPRAQAGRADRAPLVPIVAGPWRHGAPPAAVPAWVSVGGFGGLIAYRMADDPGETELVVRAVGVPDERNPAWAVVVDVPVDEQVLAELREATGIELVAVDLVPPAGESARSVMASRGRQRPVLHRTGQDTRRWAWNSVTLFDYTEWETGLTGTLLMSIRVSLAEIYDRISAAQSRVGNLSLGYLFMLALAAIAVLFLIIEAVALVMGVALARSITGAIHELFEGTERVRVGDFSHRIRIATRDQLGELADSFNEMTASIQDLLAQREEKRRLEEELRIAREIQMSLLPRGALRLPGLSVTALCVPAREVGGDYYDFFRLGERRLGILVADVAGKGTSAALYMAELKGLVLSLSTIYQSPRQLLVEVNRIISDNIDTRSFITMTYAVIDLDARTITFARAGHTPLVHVPGGPGPRRARVLAPDGIVLGLRIEAVARRFGELLVESTQPLGPGDVLVLYTDGLTEAMNADGDLFGDQRLLALVEEHGHETTEVLRERILREVEAFVGDAEPHDDLTFVLVKVDEAEARAEEPAEARAEEPAEARAAAATA